MDKIIAGYDSEEEEEKSTQNASMEAESEQPSDDKKLRLQAEYDSFEQMVMGEAPQLPASDPVASAQAEGHPVEKESHHSSSSSSDDEHSEEEEQKKAAEFKSGSPKKDKSGSESSEEEEDDSEEEEESSTATSSEEEEEEKAADKPPQDSDVKPSEIASKDDVKASIRPKQRERSRSRSRDRGHHGHRRPRRSRDHRRRDSGHRRRLRRSRSRHRRHRRSHSRDRGRRHGSHSPNGRRSRSPRRRHRRDRRRRRSPNRGERRRSPGGKEEKKPRNFKEMMKQQLLEAASSKGGTISSNAKPVSVTMPTSGSVNLVTLSGSGEKVTPQQALLQTMAAMHAKAQEVTGVAVPKYYNPAAVNPMKYAEQVQKRKLLWGKDKKTTDQKSSTQWQAAAFAGDQSGGQAAKFRRLMGMKAGEVPAESGQPSTSGEGQGAELSKLSEEQRRKQEELFQHLNSQYEFARMATHTHRGIGLGFASQGIPDLKDPPHS